MTTLDELGLGEAQVPWWAVGAVDLRPGTDEYKVRRVAQHGHLGRVGKSSALIEVWREIVGEARKLEAEVGSPGGLVEADPERARTSALYDARAFVELAGILDDTLKVPLLKDFHIRTIRALRTQEHALVLLPFGHGKSWLSNIVVSLMDWAEEPEFTQGRIYYNDKFSNLWARKLMAILENNKTLHKLFPWVQRPYPENPVKAWWSTNGFCIEGKRAMEPNFECWGANAGITGRRYWRVICDDWINSEIASSQVINDKFWDYFHTGPLSMNLPGLKHRKPYHTKAGTVGVVGTLFHKMDFNYRLAREWREIGYPVMRVDVYTDKSQTQVIWPEERPIEYVERMKRSMGDKGFRLRMRNVVVEEGDASFREDDVDQAFSDTHLFGDAMGLPCIVGFDPGAGKRTKSSKWPAAVVLAFEADRIHLVRWATWEFPMPKQIERLAAWAREYNCPVAVEDNNQQIAYKHWMEKEFPDVKVICHTTTQNKRDWAQGVESLIPFFEQHNITIHAVAASDSLKRQLRDELVLYPQGKTTDLVMATWIAKHQWELRLQHFQGTFRQNQPSYVTRPRGGGVTIDLKALREAARGKGSGWTNIPGVMDPEQRRRANEMLRDSDKR